MFGRAFHDKTLTLCDILSEILQLKPHAMLFPWENMHKFSAWLPITLSFPEWKVVYLDEVDRLALVP